MCLLITNDPRRKEKSRRQLIFHHYLPRSSQPSPSRTFQRITSANPQTIQNVSRSLPGPRLRLRKPERFQQWYRIRRHGHRLSLRCLPVRRVLCPCPRQEGRSDSLQGLWSPCALQGAYQAVRSPFTLKLLRKSSFDCALADFFFLLDSMVQFEARWNIKWWRIMGLDRTCGLGVEGTQLVISLRFFILVLTNYASNGALGVSNK